MNALLYLVAYDIADPKRLGRVHRFLVQRAMPLQYSVFLQPADDAAIEATVAGLRGLINPAHDDVRIYRLPERCEPHILGRQWLPEGVLLAAQPGLRAFEKESAVRVQLEEVCPSPGAALTLKE